MVKQILAFAMSVTMLASTCLTAAAEVIAPQSDYKNSPYSSHEDCSVHSHSDIDSHHDHCHEEASCSAHSHDELCAETVKVAIFVL